MLAFFRERANKMFCAFSEPKDPGTPKYQAALLVKIKTKA